MQYCSTITRFEDGRKTIGSGYGVSSQYWSVLIYNKLSEIGEVIGRWYHEESEVLVNRGIRLNTCTTKKNVYKNNIKWL